MGFSNGNPKPNSGSSERVPELFSELRSSFFGLEFEKVAKKFIDREDEMNEHLFELEKIVERIKKDNDLLLIENEKLKDDLKKKQVKIDGLTVAKLAYEKDAKHVGSEKVRDLKKENEDLKKKIRVSRQRFTDLDKRVSKLEESGKEFGGVGLLRCSSSQNNVVAKQHKHCDTPVAAAAAAGKSRLTLSCEKGAPNKRTIPKVQEVISIDEDEDDDDQYISTILKRKEVPTETKKGYNSDQYNSDDISVFKSRRVSKEIEKEAVISGETQNRKNMDHDLHDDQQRITLNPLSTPNVSEIKPKNLISKLNNETERWQSETDMLEEFEKDDELCLNAICALHRQKVRVNPFLLSRLTQLARMLMDGDPQQKLKKKASELKQFDLNQCRRFAKEDYLSALFDIYQKKVDPFFPSSSSSKENMSDD